MSRWSDYLPSFDTHSKLAGIPLPQAIEKMDAAIRQGVADGSLLGSEAVAHVVERAWHGLGRPSYRVAPPLAEALAETNLDLAAEFVRFPHAAFALELPRAFSVLNRNGHRLSGLLVSAVRDEEVGVAGARSIRAEVPDGEGRWRFVVLQSWEDEEETPAIFLLTLSPGESIASRISEAETGATDTVTRARHDPTITDPVTTRRFVSLALGAALFAVGANAQIIRPAAPSTKRRSARKAANRPPEPRRWILGADISLPRRGGRVAPTEESDEEREGRSLRWAHIRQGHLRLMPTGPRSDRSYSLRYIAPTIVRPDLPLVPRATRHTMDVPQGDSEEKAK